MGHPFTEIVCLAASSCLCWARTSHTAQAILTCGSVRKIRLSGSCLPKCSQLDRLYRDLTWEVTGSRFKSESSALLFSASTPFRKATQQVRGVRNPRTESHTPELSICGAADGWIILTGLVIQWKGFISLLKCRYRQKDFHTLYLSWVWPGQG